MEKKIRKIKAFIRKCGVFALCFVMLFALTGVYGASAKGDTSTLSDYTREENILEFGTMEYEGLPKPGDTSLTNGDKITFKITVSELFESAVKNGYLFDTDQMTLQLPETGLTYSLKKPSSDTLSFKIMDGTTGKREEVRALITINENGLLTVDWDEKSPGYSLLADARDVYFELEVEGTVNNNSDVIRLDGNQEYYVDNTAMLGFTKTFTASNPDDDADSGLSALINEKIANLTKEQRKDFKFTATFWQADEYQASADKKELIRDEDGHIIFKKKTVQFTLGDDNVTYNEKDGVYSITWENLMPRPTENVTIVETGHATLAGFTYNDSKLDTATVSPEEWEPSAYNVVTLTNDYIQDQGTLKLKKHLQTGGALTWDNINNDQKAKIKYRLHGTTLSGDAYAYPPDNNGVAQYANFGNAADGEITIQNIPAGHYTLTELATIDGYNWVSAMYKIGSQQGFEEFGTEPYTTAQTIPGSESEIQQGGPIGINKGAETTVELSNQYVKRQGDISLTKAFAGSELTDDQKKQATFYMKQGNKYVWFISGRLGYQYVGMTDRDDNQPAAGAICTFNPLLYRGATFNAHGLPEGEYVVYETNADFGGYTRTTTVQIGEGDATTVSNNSFSLSVKDKETTAATITNTYADKGSLTVKKTIDGRQKHALSENEKQNITFTLQKFNVNTPGWEKVDIADNPITYKKMSSGSKTWNNLPYGEYRVIEAVSGVNGNYTVSTKYTVKDYELTNGSYQLGTESSAADGLTTTSVQVQNPYAGATDKANQNVSPAVVSFTNTYAPITTNMEITKTLGAAYPLSDKRDELVSNLKFVVKDSSGNTLKWTKKNGKYVLNASGSITEISYSDMTDSKAVLTGLPVGDTYTVTEINSIVTGYDRVTTVTNGDSTKSYPEAGDAPEADATLVKGQMAQVSFHNEYKPIANLVVTKKFAGDLPNAYCEENILPHLSFKITVSEGGTTKYVKDTNGTLTDNASEAKAFAYNELTNVTLPGDKTYTITEYNRDLGGDLSKDYDITTWNTVTDSKNTSGGSGTAEYDTDREVYLAPGADKTIEFTNQYRNKEGIIPVTAGWVHNFKTWKGLDGGGCDGTEGNTVKGNVRFDLYRKEADGSGEYLYLTYTLQELVGTEGNGGKALVLPEGNYRLVERDADVPGYQRVTSVTILNNDQMATNPDTMLTANGVEFEVKTNARISITLANVYYPQGDLTITKTISQDGDLTSLTNEQKEKVSFTLTNTITDETKGPVTLKSFTNGSYTFEDLLVGYFEKDGNTWKLVPYTYKITESNSIAYYDCVTTVSISSGSGTPDSQKAEGTIQMTRPGDTGTYSAKMAFTNKYVRHVGSLEISKAFSPADLSADSKNKVTFKILNPANQAIRWTTADHKYTTQTGTGTTDTFTYANMTDGKFTITGLPTSENNTTQTYTVVESNADIESYSRTTSFTVTNGSNSPINGSGLNASVRIDKNATSSVAFTNTYSAVGSLQVKKTFEMLNGAELPESDRDKVTFTVTLDGVTKNPDKVEKGTDGVYTYIFNNLPLGTYTVTELNADRSGFTRTTTMTVGTNSVRSMKDPALDSTAANDEGTPSIDATVTHNQIAQVNVVNSYTESGKIWIRKSMPQTMKLKEGEADKIVFAIRNEKNELLKAGDDFVLDENRNAIGTITYGQLSNEPVLEGLPAGKYTVEEIILGKCNDITDAGSLFYGYVFTSTECVVTVSGSGTKLGEKTYTHDNKLAKMKTDEYRVGADGVIFDFTNNYTQVNPLYVEKSARNYPTTDIKDTDGTTVLPVWEFIVTVNHLSADSAENGQTVLRDEFDGNLFKLCTAEGFQPKITGGQLVSYNAETSGKVYYTIRANEVPQEIKLVYYLQVKDRTALAELLDSKPKTEKTESEQNKNDTFDTATWTFNNTIYYKPLPTSNQESFDTEEYYYAMAPISKEIILTENSAEVTFKLKVNPDGMHIGTENTLTILDKVSSNVIIDKSSFSVNPAGCNINVADYTASDEYDLVITVPNGVSMVITYKGRIVPSGNGGLEDVTNTASMNGMTTRVEREVQTTSEGEGGGSTYVVTLYKYGTGFAEPLQGATFKLYEGEEKTAVGEYTTNAEGKAVVSKLNLAGDAGLAAHQLYRLEEVEAPTGFTITEGETIYFTLVTTLAEMESGNYEYPVLNGATLEAENSPLETEVQLFAKKQLSGMPLSENQFSIGLYEKGVPQQDAKQNDANGNVTFDKIRYSYSDFRQVDANGNVSYVTPLKREYTIKEIVPTGATTIKAPGSDTLIGYKKDGILYDITEYTAEVEINLIVEGDNQQLVPTVTYKKNGQALTANEIPTFRNQYSAEAAVTLAGTKNLLNADAIQTAFKFEVALGNSKAVIQSPASEGSTVAIPYPAIRFVIDPTLADDAASVAASADAIVVTANSFAGFDQFDNGTAAEGYDYGFEFKVREIPDENDSRFEWDENEHTFTVSIRDNGKGAIETAIVGAPTALDFVNTYYGSVQITKNVTVGGKQSNSTLADGTYTFAVYTDANCSTLATTYGTKTPAVTSITIQNGVSTTGYILGLEPGTYYVKEIEPAAETGMVLVSEKNPVKIEITENTEAPVPSVAFTNNRPCSLTVAKQVTGTNFRNVAFSFEITMAEAAGKTFSCQYAGNNETRPTSVTFDANGKCTVQLKGDESVTIMELPYDAAYSIEELTPPAGYTAVTETVNAKIDAPEKSHTFTNSYAASGSVTLNAKKLLQVAQGDNYTGDELFTFLLTGYEESGENNVLRSMEGNVASQDVAINGTASWTIDFTSGGTYSYTIQELVRSDKTPGMTYDGAVHSVTVEMTDHGDGTITPDVTYDGEKVSVLDITNTYQRPKGTAVIHATKAMTGNLYPYEEPLAEDGTDENGGDEDEGDVDGNEDKVLNEFIFKLTPDSHPQTTDTNNVFDEEAAQTVGVGETASWNLRFDRKGTYTYTLEELMGTEPGVLYDQTKYTVTIEVDYADDLMSLVTTVTYDDGETDQEQPETADGVVFTNQYSKIVYQPEIRKLVTGEPNVPKEIFTFTLTDGKLPPDCYTDTAEYLFDPAEFSGNNKDGDGEENGADDETGEKPSTAKFKEITYHKPGTYTYYITENVPEKKTRGMNYSNAQIVLTVVVEQDEYGALSLTASYTEDGTFTNVYKPSEVYDFKVSFTKKWEGTPGPGIEWTLYDSDGNVIHKKFNKYVISDDEWYYEAWFNSDKGYYLIENIPFGYMPRYQNIGVHADVIDRCYNGGTIINIKVPETGEQSDMAFWLTWLSISMGGLMVFTVRKIRNRRAH